MNNLLIFFALPVATIILSVVLQKILKTPLLVAATFFSVYLVISFAFFDASFLVFAILYTILSYVTAVLVRWCNINLISDATLIQSSTEETTNTTGVSNGNGCCNCRRRIR